MIIIAMVISGSFLYALLKPPLRDEKISSTHANDPESPRMLPLAEQVGAHSNG